MWQPNCSLSLWEAQYKGGLGETCDNLTTTLDSVCNASAGDIPCDSSAPGNIVNLCIFHCDTCPRYLRSADYNTRILYLKPIMGDPANDNGVFFSFILALLCVFGSVANVLTIIVILRNKVLQATSHYLLSLAMSDLLMLLATAPVEIKFQLHYWPWYVPELFCRLHHYVKEACLYTTVLHIVAFTIERYIVICHPMRARTMLSRSRASKAIVLIWICSFILATPVFVFHGTEELCRGIPESKFCVQSLEHEKYLTLFHGISSLFLFFIPMTSIIVLYSLIARTLYAKNITSGRRTSTLRIPKNPASKKKKKQQSTNDAVDKARHHAVKLLGKIIELFAMINGKPNAR